MRVTLPPPDTDVQPSDSGVLYFVTYDIPSTLDVVRDQFRVALRAHGWRRLHKSLWVCERDIRHTALKEAEGLGIEPHVFIGTGALALPYRRRPVAAELEEMRTALREARRDAGQDIRAAYLRWVEVTERLRQPSAAFMRTGDLRRRWEASTRRLQRALAADASSSRKASE